MLIPGPFTGFYEKESEELLKPEMERPERVLALDQSAFEDQVERAFRLVDGSV